MITDTDIAQGPLVFVCVTSAGAFGVCLWHRFAGTRRGERPALEGTAVEPATGHTRANAQRNRERRGLLFEAVTTRLGLRPRRYPRGVEGRLAAAFDGVISPRPSDARDDSAGRGEPVQAAELP